MLQQSTGIEQYYNILTKNSVTKQLTLTPVWYAWLFGQIERDKILKGQPSKF